MLENATDFGVSSRPDAVGMAQKMLRDGAIKVQGSLAGFEDKQGSWYSFRQVRGEQLQRLGLAPGSEDDAGAAAAAAGDGDNTDDADAAAPSTEA